MDEERIFSMSAFEAAYLIRSFRKKNPELNTSDLINTARAIRADFYPHDYEAGMALERQIDIEISIPIEQFFEAALDALILERRPLWARLAPTGRNHVLQAIGVNGAQCLRAAGLLSSSARAIDWWDALASANRSERDARLLAQGREGERLSLAYEAARLEREGIDLQPIWVAVDDNTVGYDILSYSLHEGSKINRLIEVKTTQYEPLRMILSRNEWETAERFGSAFEFHLWKLPEGKLTILSIEQIRPNIPADHGCGKWVSVEIWPP